MQPATQPTSLILERGRRITHAPALGDWLRQLREQSGLTKEDAARAIDSEPRSLRRWENAGDVPNGLMLLRMFSAYGVRLSHAPPWDAPLALNDELADIRATLSELREGVQLAAAGTALGRQQMLVRMVEQGAPLTREERDRLLAMAAREREVAELMLQQADELEARLS